MMKPGKDPHQWCDFRNECDLLTHNACNRKEYLHQQVTADNFRKKIKVLTESKAP